jgi:hypothetical protein
MSCFFAYPYIFECSEFEIQFFCVYGCVYELSDIPCAIYTRASDCDMDLPSSDGNNDRNDSLNDGDAVKGGTTSTNTDLSAQDGVSTEQSNEEDDALNEVPDAQGRTTPTEKTDLNVHDGVSTNKTNDETGDAKDNEVNGDQGGTIVNEIDLTVESVGDVGFIIFSLETSNIKYELIMCLPLYCSC